MLRPGHFFDDRHTEILPLPAFHVIPVKSKLHCYGPAVVRSFKFMHINIQTGVRQFGIVDSYPVVCAPAHAPGGIYLDSQGIFRLKLTQLLLECPNLNVGGYPVIYVTFAHRCDQIEDRCIVFGAQQLDIFGMRPDEWQRRAGWTSE